MKRYPSSKSILIAVGILILIDSTVGCYCEESITYSSCQDIRNVSVKGQGILSTDTLLKNCTSDFDGELFKIVDYVNDGCKVIEYDLDISFCPTSVATSIANEIIRHNNDNELQFRVRKLTTLPESIFQGNQSRLKHMDLKGINLTTLPERIFVDLTELKRLSITATSMMTLPENIFQSQTNLIVLSLENNQLRKLNELNELKLSGNTLRRLPENIFKSLTNLRELMLSQNQLSALPEKIFDSQTNMK